MKRRFPLVFISGVFLFGCTTLVPSLRWALTQSTLLASSADDHVAILPVLPRQREHSFDAKHQENSFSACLLVMDDNQRLTEWIAYHHYVLPLRYLIVAVDPRSKTSPMAVLRKWEPFMKIVVWQNDHFVPPHRRTLGRNASMEEKTRLHRARQSFFLSACASAMREANRTYVALIDSDEYLTFNRPEGVALSGEAPEDLRALPAPSVKEPGSILRILRDAPPNSTLAAPCLPIYRVLFNAKESLDTERQFDVPFNFNATRFDTLRYRYRMNDAVARTSFTQLGKNIMDVSRINPNDLTKPRKYFPNPHQILYPDYCWNVHSVRDPVSFFRVNHYLGSWESYSLRDDARNTQGWRSMETWEKTTRDMKDKSDDTIRPWLGGFVEQYGVAKAAYLLSDVGYIAPNDESNR